MENFVLYVLKINLFAAVCILTVFIISYFVKGRYSSQWKYLMWLFIALFMLIPMNLFAETAVIELKLPHGEIPAAVSAGGDERFTAEPSVSGVHGQKNAGNSEKASAETQEFTKITTADILNAMFYIWLLGIVIVAAGRIVSYKLSLSEIRRWSVAVKDENTRTLYEYICGEMQISKQPKLVLNKNLKSPLLAGLMKTRLYLPDTSYTEKELMLIFVHELSHYRNRDLWYKTLLMAVNTIYWFNPVIYFMVKEAEKDVEYICDSKVVAKCSRSDCMLYNRLLLKTAAGSTAIHYLSASLNDSTTAFKERILYMMKAKTLKKGILPVLVLTISLVASNAVIGCTMKVYATAEKKDIQKETGYNSLSLQNMDNTPAASKMKADKPPVQDNSTRQKPPDKQEPVTVSSETPKAAPNATPEPAPESTPEPTQAVTPAPTPVVVQEVTPEPTQEPVTDENPGSSSPPPESPEDPGQVSAAVQLIEGGYMEDAGSGDEGIERYFEVSVTNITATSFDFTVYDVDAVSGSSVIVFSTGTAFFTGDGTTAAYEDENYTLSFSFPDNHASYPMATDLMISGFPLLEGKTFVNIGVSVS